MFRNSNNKNTTTTTIATTIKRGSTATATVPVVADAVPILGNPYPIPNVYRLVGKKQYTDFSNNNTSTLLQPSIKFRTIESSSTSIVIIEEVCDPLLIQYDSVRYHIGRVVISINDINVRDSYHATNLLIKSSSGSNENDTNDNNNDNEYYTILSRDPITVPFCKLIIGTYNVHSNPGISFASTRHETLVQVSRILVDGPFNNNNSNNENKQQSAAVTQAQVKIGDIVLAVNGYPVTTTEQAYRALQLSKNTSIEAADQQGPIRSTTTMNKNNRVLHSNTIILYVIDIMQLRCSILREIKCSKHLSFNKVRIETTDTTYNNSNGNNNDAIFIVHDMHLALVKFDTNTQNIYDKEQYRHRFTKNEVRIYQDVVIPFLRHCNEIIEKRMLTLEDSVACESWTNSIPYLPIHVQLQHRQQHHHDHHQQQQHYSLVHHDDDDDTAVVVPSSSSLLQYHQSLDRATNGTTINSNTTTHRNGIVQFDAISYLLSNDNHLSSTSAVYNRRGHAATTISDDDNEIILDAVAVPISSQDQVNCQSQIASPSLIENRNNDRQHEV